MSWEWESCDGSCTGVTLLIRPAVSVTLTCTGPYRVLMVCPSALRVPDDAEEDERGLGWAECRWVLCVGVGLEPAEGELAVTGASATWRPAPAGLGLELEQENQAGDGGDDGEGDAFHAVLSETELLGVHVTIGYAGGCESVLGDGHERLRPA